MLLPRVLFSFTFLCSIQPILAQVEFQGDILPILTANCAGSGCHIGQRTSGVELTEYETVIDSMGFQYGVSVVKPGDSSGSPVIDKLASVQPAFGSRMPLGRAPLSELEIDLIALWIDEGARDVSKTIRGDVDLNGTLSLPDVIAILQFLFIPGTEIKCEAAADFDGNGNRTLADAIGILIALFLAPDIEPDTVVCFDRAPFE